MTDRSARVLRLDQYRRQGPPPRRDERTWDQKLDALRIWFSKLEQREQAQVREIVMDPDLQPDLEQQAAKLVELLNTHRRKASPRSRGFDPTNRAVLKHARARLAEGYDYSDLAAVVIRKSKEACSGEYDPRWLRPSTLWNAEKCAAYVAELEA